MTDFGGKGSRRVFAARLLREAQTQASTSVVSLVPSIVAMPVGTLVSTDRLPAVSTAGAAKTLTPANFRAYILPDGDKGDITTSASGATWTIDNGVVSYAKIQNVAANSFLANVTGSPASAQEIATTRIPLFASAITGTPSGTTYLRGDGVWATVSAGSGDVVGPASATDNAVARFDLTTGKLIQNSGLFLSDASILSAATLSTSSSVPITINATDALLTLIGRGVTIKPGAITPFKVRDPGDSYDAFKVATDVTIQAASNPKLIFTDGSFTGSISVNGSGRMVYDSVSTNPSHYFEDPVRIAGLNSGGGTVYALEVTGTASSATNLVGVGSLPTAESVLTDLISAQLEVAVGVGSVVNAYGLKVANIAVGSSLNYAIYTGTGLVRFGDNVDLASGKVYKINNVQVVGAQGAAVTAPSGGTVQDSEARTAIASLISRLQAHGLIA